MNEREEDILAKVKELLIEYYDPQKIILFRSRAEDKNRSAYGFDFAIESAAEIESQKRNELLGKIDEMAGLYKVDLVHLESVHPEFKDIILETGKIIYEKRN